MSIEPTQADRDAAAEYVAENFSNQQAEQTRRGEAFVHLVQAFARHRLASTPASGDADAAAEVETMRQMRETARDMGYRDVLDALEALADMRTPASGEVVAWMYEYHPKLPETRPGAVDIKRDRTKLPLAKGWTETPLYKLTAPSHPAADLVAILHQYRSDMLRPPAPDSRLRRIAMIDAAIAKFGRDA